MVSARLPHARSRRRQSKVYGHSSDFSTTCSARRESSMLRRRWGLTPTMRRRFSQGWHRRRRLSSKNLILWESDPFDEAPVLGVQMKLAWSGRRNRRDLVESAPDSIPRQERIRRAGHSPAQKPRGFRWDFDKTLAERGQAPAENSQQFRKPGRQRRI